jgi:dynein heavy chain
LKRKSLKQRHWTQIFTIIKAPHLKTSKNFTIINLREVHIQNYFDEVRSIIEQANLELKYENILKKIENEWEHLKLDIVPYVQVPDTFILNESEKITSTIEEHLTTLEAVQKSKNATHVKDQIDEWVKNLVVMLENLEKWIEAQNNWIYLNPIFSSPQIQDALPKEYKQFTELQETFKRILWSSYHNSKATYNLLINNRVEVFNNLISYFSNIQKNVDDYLENRRLQFPRFFFMSDSNFLEFLVKSNAKENIDHLVHILFPGARKLFIKMMEASEPEVPISEGNELATINEHKEDIVKMAHLTTDPPISLKDYNEIGMTMTDLENKLLEDGIFINEKPRPKDYSYQILGMISQMSDLFLLERSVDYNLKTEQWLK